MKLTTFRNKNCRFNFAVKEIKSVLHKTGIFKHLFYSCRFLTSFCRETVCNRKVLYQETLCSSKRLKSGNVWWQETFCEKTFSKETICKIVGAPIGAYKNLQLNYV